MVGAGEQCAICPPAREGTIHPHAVPSLPGRLEHRWFAPPLPANSPLQPQHSTHVVGEHLCSQQETSGVTATLGRLPSRSPAPSLTPGQ